MAETVAIGPETLMRDVLVHYPGAQRALFAKYHIGGCQSCGFEPDETLSQVCARNEDIPIAEAIAEINASHAADSRVQISPKELAEALPQSPAPLLIDVRTREEHEAVSIPGSRFWSQDLIQEIFGSWEKESMIVVYDHAGTRSLDSAAYLLGHGFANTRSLEGGIDAYSREADASIPRYRIEIEE